jgi:hypothetical protein
MDRGLPSRTSTAQGLNLDDPYPTSGHRIRNCRTFFPSFRGRPPRGFIALFVPDNPGLPNKQHCDVAKGHALASSLPRCGAQTGVCTPHASHHTTNHLPLRRVVAGQVATFRGDGQASGGLPPWAREGPPRSPRPSRVNPLFGPLEGVACQAPRCLG